MGSGCSEENSVVEEINDRNVELSISVKTFKNIQLIRLDPVFEKQDDFKIESLRVDYGGSKILKLTSKELRKYVTTVHNVVIAQKNMKLTNIDNDPIINFSSKFVSDINQKAKYGKIKKDRRVYNCFINSAIETSNNKNRKFTSMDMFPTTLAVLGVDIDGDRLGLGTNLYADKETLAEKYGYEYIEQELSKNLKFYNKDILGE